MCFVEKRGGEKQAKKKAMEEALFHVQYSAFPLRPSVLVLRGKQTNLLGRARNQEGVFYTRR